MASPQTEYGFTMIPNEQLEAIAKYNCSGTQKEIILVLMRYSYGFQKSNAELSIRFIAKATNRAYQKISAALNDLIIKKVIKVEQDYSINHQSRVLSLNKNYEEWEGSTPSGLQSPHGLQSPSGVENSTPSGLQNSTPKRVQINNNINKTLKKIYSQDSKEFELSSLLLDLIKNRNPKHKQPDLQSWSKHIGSMIHTDKREPGEIEKVIRWCQNDSFWQNNILSTQKLRDKFDQLYLKMKEVKSANGKFNYQQSKSEFSVIS